MPFHHDLGDMHSDTRSFTTADVNDFDMGRPVQIVDIDKFDNSLVLNEEALQSILMRDVVAGRKIAVISVAGAFRKGKSFLLNFFLRYLKYGEEANWLSDETVPLKGFDWKGGCDLHTVGIWMWDKPFFIKLPSGELVVILLMDTQGAFDCQSTMKKTASIFALSTLISSVQIYNLSSNIQENDLQNLECFTEYGRLAMDESFSKPFQTLTFLVRDWCWNDDAPCGFEGGQEILERRLKVADKQSDELKNVRRHIRSCFTDVNCFLMPHPGLNVTKKTFKGSLSEIRTDFKDQLAVFVPRILSSKRIVLKEINGQKIYGQQLMEYFRTYLKIFKSGMLPEMKSVFMATAEANHLTALKSAKARYIEHMRQICGEDKPSLSVEKLQEHDQICRTISLELFKSEKKMGADFFGEEYLELLDHEIGIIYKKDFELPNKAKKKQEEKAAFWRRIAIGGAAGIAVGVGAVVAYAVPVVATGLVALFRFMR